MKKIKKILSLIVSYTPTNGLRIALYRSLFGYRFGTGTRLGLGVIIAVDRMECGSNVSIRRGTSFMGPICVILGANTSIGRYNKFECGDGVADPKHAHMNYAREFVTGEDCLINEGHLFDILGRIHIGKGSWIAGFASQFITHGASVMNRDIHIGEQCFIGSAVRFAPGAGIGDRVMVGMGSVVTKALTDDDVVVAGVPAKVIRARDDGDYHFEKNW